MKNIYIVKLNLNGKTYYKVGQTGLDNIVSRFKRFKKYNYEIVKVWELDDEMCLYLELLVHEKFKHLSVVFPENICGKTEFYLCVDDIVLFIETNKNSMICTGLASKDFKGVSTTLKKTVSKIQEDITLKKKDFDISYKIIGFWLYNYIYLKSQNYSHLKFRLGTGGEDIVKFTSHSILVKWTKVLGDLGFIEIVTGTGYTPSYISFTQKFENMVELTPEIFRVLTKSDMSEYHRNFFYHDKVYDSV